MITTIEIVRERENEKEATYKAIRGTQQAAGRTAGEALDALEEKLAGPEQEKDEGTLVILQRFQPDIFFTAEQQTRLRELMDRFHDVGNKSKNLSTEEKQELEQLINAELQAAISRATSILSQASRSSS